MLKVFLKSFGISFVSLLSVSVILIITLSHPLTQGGSDVLLFWAAYGLGPTFFVLSAVISLIIASIYSVMSRGQTTQSENQSRPHSIRFALYTLMILLALLVLYGLIVGFYVE